MKFDLVLRPELVRAVHKSDGFVFPSMDREARLVNRLSCDFTIFHTSNDKDLSRTFKYKIFRNVSMCTSLLSGLTLVLGEGVDSVLVVFGLPFPQTTSDQPETFPLLSKKDFYRFLGRSRDRCFVRSSSTEIDILHLNI